MIKNLVICFGILCLWGLFHQAYAEDLIEGNSVYDRTTAIPFTELTRGTLECEGFRRTRTPQDDVADQRAALIASLTALQQAYVAVGNLDAALDVREQIRALENHAKVTLPAIPTSTPPKAENFLFTGSLRDLRGQHDKTVMVRVTGTVAGSVYGNKIYTDDSNLAAAAVHAGVLKKDESAIIVVKILPGQNSYESVQSNEISSYGWGPYAASFSVEGKVEETFNPRDFRGNQDSTQQQHTTLVLVTGSTTGTVWGSEIFTDDSHLNTAATHAGLVKVGETKVVRLTIQPGKKTYTGSTKNGVTTRDYAEWYGSYSLHEYQ